MKPPFSLLVIHGDGSRVSRVYLPRWILYGTLGSLAAIVVASFSGEYLLGRRDGDQVAALRRRVDDQRALIDSFHTRVAAGRGEKIDWEAVHTRMWGAPGHEAGAEALGAPPDALAPGARGEPTPPDDLDVLAAGVAP